MPGITLDLGNAKISKSLFLQPKGMFKIDSNYNTVIIIVCDFTLFLVFPQFLRLNFYFCTYCWLCKIDY